MAETKDKGGLGFRDLEAFNVALRCKQVWRVITQPNLLMAKILKYKYFPHSDMLKATTKPIDSWLWKNWNVAKFLVKEGCNWQVGNGSSINIWEDCWLTGAQLKRVLSREPQGCTTQRVKDLMHQNRAGWNKELLQQLFSESEVQNIMQIPISSLRVANRLVWSNSKNGQYLIALGYSLAKISQSRKKGDEGTSRRTAEEEGRMWNKIWNLKIKKKVQHFIWKVCHNRIPVNVNLNKREVDINKTCKLCRDDPETIEHMFFHCERTKLIWKLAP